MSLRISTARETAGRRNTPDDGGAGDFYLARLVKLIPGEAVVAYPFLNSRAQDVIADAGEWSAQHQSPAASIGETATGAGAATPDHWLLIAMAWLMLAVVILLRWQATRGADGAPQWGAIIIAAVSFMLWVPVMDGTFGLIDVVQSYAMTVWPPAIERFIPELLLIIWTILTPVFYKPAA